MGDYISKETLNKGRIIEILESNDPNTLEELFRVARKAREDIFKKKIFMYGFVYFSTYCRNNCNFCYFRNSNKIDRYRKSSEEIIGLSKALKDSGVNLIDLTMGEDPYYYKEDFKSVLELSKYIKEELDMPVMISPGVISNSLIDKFSDIDTDWYALYQETHNRELFSKLRYDQSYDERMEGKEYARSKGMLIEEGLLSGVGESYEDIADSLMEMGRIGASQVRVMSFIPQEGSPMEGMKTPDRNLELKIIALMRILYPWSLIPASLDVDGISGLKDRVNAGGNVITSIIPPKTGLVGVAHSTMDVDDGGRTAVEAIKILKDMGLAPASTEEYKDYLIKLKNR